MAIQPVTHSGPSFRGEVNSSFSRIKSLVMLLLLHIHKVDGENIILHDPITTSNDHELMVALVASSILLITAFSKRPFYE